MQLHLAWQALLAALLVTPRKAQQKAPLNFTFQLFLCCEYSAILILLLPSYPVVVSQVLQRLLAQFRGNLLEVVGFNSTGSKADALRVS